MFSKAFFILESLRGRIYKENTRSDRLSADTSDGDR